jgi:hypothetical protein
MQKSSKQKSSNESNQVQTGLQTLVLDDMEGQFGLMLRDKDNHDNYVLIKLEDLDRIFEYYSEFKNQLVTYKKKSGKNELH